MRFRPRRLQGESLELRQLMAVDVLEGAEPANSTAASAVVFTFPADDGTAVLKGGTNKDDKDFFAFTAPANGTLNATLLQTGATLELEDAGSREIMELEPKDGVTAGTVQLSAGERYTVRLRGTEKAATQYEATLVFTPSDTTAPPTGGNTGGEPGDDHGGHGNEPGDDNGQDGGVVTPPTSEDPAATVVAEAEPNSARFTANQFSLDGSTRLEGAASKEDRDYFAFTVPANGNFTIGLRTTAAKMQVEIEDQSGREVLELEPHDGISSGTVALVAGRTYFLRVKADDAPAVAYKVDLQPATAGTPTDAPPAATVTAAAAQANKFDISGDDSVGPLDALLIINHLNARHDDHPSAHDLSEIAFDVDDDGSVAPLDVLRIINFLNSQRASSSTHDAGDDHGVDVLVETETEQHNGADDIASSADAYYAQFELEHEQEAEHEGFERESEWEGIDG